MTGEIIAIIGVGISLGVFIFLSLTVYLGLNPIRKSIDKLGDKVEDLETRLARIERRLGVLAPTFVDGETAS